ncbi:MAG: transposase [Pirellulaceae bacterium]
MASEALFQRFMARAPVAVMVRSTLEFVFAPKQVDDIFAKVAERQRASELLFSSVVDLLAMVVLRQRKSIGEAYLRVKDEWEISVRSVYNKLNGTEPQVCRALVKETAAPLVQVATALGVKRPPQLAGFRTRILDGNHLTSTEHRLEVLRGTKAGPLPGQALVVLDPDRMLILDVFPNEDGHAQERRLLPEVIASVRDRDLWIADRNFCTTNFLFGLDRAGGFFVIRQHASTLSWEKETKPKKIGLCETGTIYEQKLCLIRGDETLWVRRITIKLHQPTRAGEKEIHLLTNLKIKHANAYKVAELYLQRWTIETAFQEIEQALRSEINTLGYPGAALLGFSIACITYNAMSIAKWAIEAEHPEQIERDKISGYYLAAAVSEDYGGMMIALPEKEWTRRFGKISAEELAIHLRACAKHVQPDSYRKNVRGPKKPRPKRTSGKTDHHVSTARLLAAQI